jgi:hypothetical protein
MLPADSMNASELRARAVAVAVAAVLCGCASQLRDWRELGERRVPFEDAWAALVQTCSRHGYVLSDRDSDRGRGTFTSRWRTWTQGFGNSKRTRVRAEMKSVTQADAALAWEVRFCVERQRVADMARSMDPRESDWSADGQERDMEDIIEAQLRLRFGDSTIRAPQAEAAKAAPGFR